MTQKKTTIALRDLDAQCANLIGTLDTAIRNLNIMAEVGATRELAMVKTKIDEAMMWLEKYHAGVCIDLANITCL